VGKSAPWFCHDLDCPHFKVLNTTSAYELRDIAKGAWAQTTTESVLYSVGVTEGFQRLYKYIAGANEEEKVINMTVPVAVHIIPGSTFSKSVYTSHFFVPYKYQSKPPTPTNPDVTIETKPGGVFAVVQFGGFVLEQHTLTSKRDSLAAALKADGIEFDADSFVYAGYDSPARLQNRHNEVWLRVKSEAADTESSVNFA
jgi:hypothetical protein